VSTASIAMPTFDEVREYPGFNFRLGRRPAEEEIVVLLEGSPSLRTPEGVNDSAGYFDFEGKDAR
jgi:hypothetical protein